MSVGRWMINKSHCSLVEDSASSDQQLSCATEDSQVAEIMDSGLLYHLWELLKIKISSKYLEWLLFSVESLTGIPFLIFFMLCSTQEANFISQSNALDMWALGLKIAIIHWGLMISQAMS